MHALRAGIVRAWYQPKHLIQCLWPLSFLFRLLIAFRRAAYHLNWCQTVKLSVPVIVVGNITVGGNGKTPMVMALCALLKQHGWSPGIVMRGYGRKALSPMMVTTASTPDLVGDEAILIHRKTCCPVAVASKRVDAGRLLLESADINIIISDDGLSHYAISRDIEIIMFDSQRYVGNGMVLPAGPLREPISRLTEADFVVSKGQSSHSTYYLDYSVGHIQSLHTVKANHFVAKRVHAVAGIAYPESFFKLLRDMGLEVIPHSFDDHHQFKMTDFNFASRYPIVMTEKDAVKCRHLDLKNAWVLELRTRLSDNFAPALLKQLKRITNG